MGQQIVIIGAGIVGCAAAFELAKAGQKVTLVDAAGVATGATGRSFGWINASFFADPAHFRLRSEGIKAWHRLGMPGINWSGCLWFEDQGEGLDKLRDQLLELDYPVEKIGKERFSQIEPALAAIEDRALRFGGEGVAEAPAVSQELLRRAKWAGAMSHFGVEVEGIEVSGGAVQGVMTTGGRLDADRVVVAAGTGSPGLVEPLGVALPMLRRPGLLVTTRPIPHVLTHVVAAPGQEMRQMADGRLLLPTSPNHQGDTAESLTENAIDLAEAAVARATALLPGHNIVRDGISLAMRPVPGDGLPVIGPAGPEGLYLAVMHSGITLAAIAGELIAREIRQGEPAELLNTFRPDRFA